ncbi:MAG: hypothetical protein MUO23_04640 [Anaerolineales bacterium]|nr:hypothetical protein [Anaerolineales bacterium]
MKVIDKSEFRDPDGKIGIQNRLQGTFRFGLGWFGMMQAQTQLTQRLGRTLGSEFVVLRNTRIPGVPDPVPMTLIGPQGVWLIHPSTVTGIFRAQESEWLRYNARSQQFTRLKPNLQATVIGMSQTLLHFIQAQGYGLPEVQPVLAFSNPRAHVDTVNPTARVVVADAVDHFANSILQQQPIMDGEDIGLLVKALTDPPRPSEAVAPPQVSAAVDLPPAKAWEQSSGTALQPTRQVKLRKRRRRIAGMTVAQWVTLAILATLALIMVATLAMVVLRDLSGG